MNVFEGYDQAFEEDWGMTAEENHGHGSKKEMTLRNIYDIALTAIAYLSFGLFILQVIMCITLVCPTSLLHIRPFYWNFSLLDANKCRHDNDANGIGNDRRYGR